MTRSQTIRGGDGDSEIGDQVLAFGNRPEKDDLIRFRPWHTLGPFRIGTREAVWGADPLRVLDADSGHATYFSPLTRNATVDWEQHEFESSFDGQTATVHLSLSFEEVNWEFLRSIYGWAALQFQAWARSEIVYNGRDPVNILFEPTNVLEFTWNGQRVFGGDFFGFKRAPVVLRLLPGPNTVELRLVREVRAHGGWGLPSADASIKLVLVPDSSVIIVPGSLILPDIINGTVASEFASLVVCNTGPDTVEIVQVSSEHGRGLALLSPKILIAPGQSRPVGFSLSQETPSLIPSTIVLTYRPVRSVVLLNLTTPTEFTQRDFFSPHKLTFAHPSGSVSYAILRPPPPSLLRESGYDLPVMLNLHGAGVDVDGSQTRHSFDAAADLPCWMLFPTGMSPWASDDWHTWGTMDIYAALEAARRWQLMHWTGPGMTSRGLIVTGHSNGGQGAWHFAMHHPDHVLVAVMASGYTSIQNYVPYSMWTEADPMQNAVLERALSSFKHELFLDNLQRVPILIQHGTEDDNVPVYHARLMATLGRQRSLNLTFVELPGKGHWFDGVMTTPPLLEFYRQVSTPDARFQPVPSNFSFVVGLLDNWSSKNGIVVDQLESPDSLGKVSVTSITRDRSRVWYLTTSNIRRLHFDHAQTDLWPNAVRLDDWPEIIQLDKDFDVDTSFVSLGNGTWSTEPKFTPSLGQRTGLQRGAMEAILRTRGPFQLLYSTESELGFEIAVQVSRNLLQYFGADSDIRPYDQRKLANDTSGNIISILDRARTKPLDSGTFAIRADEEGVWIRSRHTVRLIPAQETGGAVWLQPLHDERLELVIWAADADGLQQAARLVPSLTGVGQPDFIVFGKDAPWKGHAGTLAMGFFDYNWEISAASFLPWQQLPVENVLSEIDPPFHPPSPRLQPTTNTLTSLQFPYSNSISQNGAQGSRMAAVVSTGSPRSNRRITPSAKVLDEVADANRTPTGGQMNHPEAEISRNMSGMEDILKRLRLNDSRTPHSANLGIKKENQEIEKILSSLNEQTRALNAQEKEMRANSKMSGNQRPSDESAGLATHTPATKGYAGIIYASSRGSDPTKVDTSEIRRIKKELEAAKSVISRQEQELAETRNLKHTMDQAIGSSSELDFGAHGDISEQTIGHLQSAFNASARPFTSRSGAWRSGEDSLSEFSVGSFPGARGIWNSQDIAGSLAGTGPRDARLSGQGYGGGYGVHPAALDVGFGGNSRTFSASTAASFGYDARVNNELPLLNPNQPGRRGVQQPRANSSMHDTLSAYCGVGLTSPPLSPLAFPQQYPFQRGAGLQPSPMTPSFPADPLQAQQGAQWSLPPAAGGQTYVTSLEPMNYRRLLDKSVSCDWKYIVDKIVCNNDQQASIFLQQKLKVGTAEQKFEIVESIVNQAYPLMINRFGNFLVQRCFEHGTPDQVVAIAEAIHGNVIALSMDPFGCHVIQKAFDSVPESHKADMVRELLRRIPDTVIHRYACHVWQKLFELRWSGEPPQIMLKVNEALHGMWHEVAMGETGSLVVQNIFENCVEEEKRPAIEEVISNIDIIAHGQFGNWCIQHLCEHGAPPDKRRVVDHILTNSYNYSIDQFASKVVEKCLKIGGHEFLDRYLGVITTARPDRPRIPLIDIAGDQYGNYLIQWILMNSHHHQREQVAVHIRKHLVSLRGSKFGSRVAMLCCNPNSATHPASGAVVNPYGAPGQQRSQWPRYR
ncbi:hypothetical protein DV738_g2889, partial [Chaetothyriales sp. CBS 135597]